MMQTMWIGVILAPVNSNQRIIYLQCLFTQVLTHKCSKYTTAEQKLKFELQLYLMKVH